MPQTARLEDIESPPTTGRASVDDIEEPPSVPEVERTVPLLKAGGDRAQTAAPTPLSLPSGTKIRPDVGTNGHGMLEVQNGTTQDAVIRLCDDATNETVRWVYVQANGSIRLTDIPQGNYQLMYAMGLDWDDGQDAFRRRPSYNQFERAFRYTEERVQEGFRYNSISVTLNSVIGGNVRTRRISREEFMKGHRHVALR